MKHHAIALALVAASWTPVAAEAQTPYPCVDELSDDEVERETRRLSQSFERHETHERIWRFGWISVFAATAVVEFAILGPRSDGAQRWNAYVAGAGATGALIQMAALPMPGVWARRRAERMPSETSADRRARLRYLLRELERTAKGHKIVHGPLSHLSGFVWSGFWGTYLTARYDDPLVSVMSYLGGPLLNELRLATAPDWARPDWERVRGGFCWGRYTDDEDRGIDLDDEAFDEGDELDPAAADDVDDGEMDEFEEDELGTTFSTDPRREAIVYPTGAGLGLAITF